MTRGLVLSLFDYTGNMVKPWAEAGYETLCVDRQHKLRRPEPRTLNVDLTTLGPLLVALHERGYSPANIIQLFAFPECTHTTGACARDWKLPGKGLRALSGALQQFATAAELAEISGCPYMFENPVGAISTHWRKWDYCFDPEDYTLFEPADNYTKKTCLWVGNGFVMPHEAKDRTLPPPDDRIHKAPPGPDRANFRSATPMGFARAVFEANHGRTNQ